MRSTAAPPTPVIQTGAEPLDFARDRLREAQWRGLFCCRSGKKRSPGYTAFQAAPPGMTESNGHKR